MGLQVSGLVVKKASTQAFLILSISLSLLYIYIYVCMVPPPKTCFSMFSLGFLFGFRAWFGGLVQVEGQSDWAVEGRGFCWV